ncbi:transposase [Streptomyces sp. NRRL F-2664]|uniref:transposase n=1 Tax=Streptomyces sp. NRRL F-2664 TaxID=1463842 RepID=UPI00131DB4AA
MRNYPPQFKADAVALYQSRPEATIRQVAADLGINPETLRNWVHSSSRPSPNATLNQTKCPTTFTHHRSPAVIAPRHTFNNHTQ